MSNFINKFIKKNNDELDNNTASQILDTIFEMADKPPNTVPLDELISYSKYREERHLTHRIVIVVILALFLLTPLLFITPSFTLVEATEDESDYSSQFEINVSSYMPISSVTAKIADMNIPVYEFGNHLYYVNPDINGEMDVTVTLINRQYITKTITVGNVDNNSPKCLSTSYDKDYIYINVNDDDSGIDYDSTKAITDSGESIYPSSYDKDEGILIFDYPKDDMIVYVPDNAGNVLQLEIIIK